MTNAWDDMRKAKEDSYFAKKDADALARLTSKKEGAPPVSPVTGQPMEEFAVQGVGVHRCPTSGGIWIGKDELSRLSEIVHGAEGHPDRTTPESQSHGWFQALLDRVAGR